jgi:AcrR family transcriptional regulator
VTVRPSHRERVRAATRDEILQVTRDLLVREGPAALTLRAIARDMGMTAPALYRYFPSLDELVSALCAELYHELASRLETVQETLPADDLSGRMRAICLAFRDWSVGHLAEFGLIFGSPLPALVSEQHRQPKHEAAMRFAGVFGALFAQIWRRSPFPVPPADEISPQLRSQLDDYLEALGGDLPVGAAQLFLSCWIRLYGMVSMEVFGHLRFALRDAGPMFDAELADALRLLGLSPT